MWGLVCQWILWSHKATNIKVIKAGVAERGKKKGNTKMRQRCESVKVSSLWYSSTKQECDWADRNGVQMKLSKGERKERKKRRQAILNDTSYFQLELAI